MLLLAIVLTLFGETLYLALRITLYNDLDDILRSSAALVINTLQADAQGNLTTEQAVGEVGSPCWQDTDSR